MGKKTRRGGVKHSRDNTPKFNKGADAYVTASLGTGGAIPSLGKSATNTGPVVEVITQRHNVKELDNIKLVNPKGEVDMNVAEQVKKHPWMKYLLVSLATVAVAGGGYVAVNKYRSHRKQAALPAEEGAPALPDAGAQHPSPEPVAGPVIPPAGKTKPRTEVPPAVQ